MTSHAKLATLHLSPMKRCWSRSFQGHPRVGAQGLRCVAFRASHNYGSKVLPVSC